MSSGTEGRGNDDAWRDRYLLCNFLVDPALASKRKRFEALSRYVRDLLADRWVKTRRAREAANPKRVYYLSMEFLIGRTLNNNILNLAAEPLVQEVMAREGWDAVGARREGAGRRPRQRRPRAGWRPASSTRWRRCSSRRSATACATSTGSSASRSTTATRSSSPTTGCASPTRGRSSRPSGSRSGSALNALRARRLLDPHHSEPAVHPDRRGLRPAGRRLRRAARSTRCGSGRPRRPTSFDFAEFSQRRLRRRGHPERRGRVAHARALPGRLDGGRADAALPPGVLPRELLARRTSSRASGRREDRAGPPCPTRSRSS